MCFQLCETRGVGQCSKSFCLILLWDLLWTVIVPGQFVFHFAELKWSAHVKYLVWNNFSCVCARQRTTIPNEVFGPRWLERHGICGLEICPRIYARNEYENISNGNFHPFWISFWIYRIYAHFYHQGVLLLPLVTTSAVPYLFTPISSPQNVVWKWKKVFDLFFLKNIYCVYFSTVVLCFADCFLFCVSRMFSAHTLQVREGRRFDSSWVHSDFQIFSAIHNYATFFSRSNIVTFERVLL